MEATARKNHYASQIGAKLGSRDGGITALLRGGNDTADKAAAHSAFYADSASFKAPAAAAAAAGASLEFLTICFIAIGEETRTRIYDSAAAFPTSFGHKVAANNGRAERAGPGSKVKRRPPAGKLHIQHLMWKEKGRGGGVWKTGAGQSFTLYG